MTGLAPTKFKSRSEDTQKIEMLLAIIVAEVIWRWWQVLRWLFSRTQAPCPGARFYFAGKIQQTLRGGLFIFIRIQPRCLNITIMTYRRLLPIVKALDVKCAEHRLVFYHGGTVNSLNAHLHSSHPSVTYRKLYLNQCTAFYPTLFCI